MFVIHIYIGLLTGCRGWAFDLEQWWLADKQIRVPRVRVSRVVMLPYRGQNEADHPIACQLT